MTDKETDVGAVPGSSLVSTLTVRTMLSVTENIEGITVIQGYLDGIVPRRVPAPVFFTTRRSSMIPITDQDILIEDGINRGIGLFSVERWRETSTISSPPLVLT
ncbi:MAG: hypothetical protein BWY05_00537 [Euryarchaeota archaeon ADurb.Bin165]|nr:MAG: hypothetical protein BWY05_00537 [Euryarchaeota archaeon ADurb.Bin165]